MKDSIWLRSFARSGFGKRIGAISGRIGSYIDRVNYTEFRSSMQKKLSPVNWFKDDTTELPSNIIGSTSGKIKIRVLHQQANMWNSIMSVCKAFASEDNVDLLVILTGARHDLAALKQQMVNEGYNYIEANDYSIVNDKPDIMLVYTSWTWPSIPLELRSMRKYTKKIYTIPLPVINPFTSIDSYIWNFHHDEIDEDACILDGYAYKLAIENDSKFHRYYKIGNPKFDSIYEIVNGHEQLPSSWKKLEGKKVVLWATDHGYTPTKNYQDVSFDVYAKSIFDYFDKNTDMGLIFRPHATLINELLRSYWSFADYNYLKDKINESSNMVWDETNNYAYAYRIVDAVLSDLNCDVIGSSLSVNKPIGVLKRNDTEVVSYNPVLTDKYRNITSEEELRCFLHDIHDSIDESANERNAARNLVISFFDGNNGNRIKEFILDDYKKDL